MVSPRGNQNSGTPPVPTPNAFLHWDVKCNCKHFEVSALLGWYTASDSPAAAQRLCLLLCVGGRGESRWYRYYAKSLPPTLVTHQHVTEQDLHQFQNISLLSIPVSADYLFLPSIPSLNDDNMATHFPLGSGAGLAAAAGWFSSVCQKQQSLAYGLSRNAMLQGLHLPSPLDDWALFLWWRFSSSDKIFCLY